jgi:hypothetical protein
MFRYPFITNARQRVKAGRCRFGPMKPTLKALGTMRLKLKYVKLLSSFAFKCNLCRYMESDFKFSPVGGGLAGAYTRQLFSST